MKEILSDCYLLIRTPSSLEVIPERGVLNVDLSTPDAVAIARRNGVADRSLADVLVSQLGLEGSTIFTHHHPGRAFTIIGSEPLLLQAHCDLGAGVPSGVQRHHPPGVRGNGRVLRQTNAKLGGLIFAVAPPVELRALIAFNLFLFVVEE